MALPRLILLSPRAQGALAALVLHGVAWALVWPALNARPAPPAAVDRGPALVYLSLTAPPPVMEGATTMPAPAVAARLPVRSREPAVIPRGVAAPPPPEPPALVALAVAPAASTPPTALPPAAAAASVPAIAPPQRVAARPLAGNALPAYPEAAREDGLQGRVRLLLSIDAQGRVDAVQWLQRSGIALLDLAARDAVRAWRYEPARSGGEAVASALTVAIRFQLDQPVSATLLASQ